MSKKLSSDFGTVNEEFDKIRAGILELEALANKYLERAQKAEELLGILDAVTTLDKIVGVATQAGMSPEEWVIQKLSETLQPITELPVDPDVLREFENMAAGRGFSLREFSTSVHVTRILKDLFGNMVI